MLKIDGQKIRDIREGKGLTQLYLATAVEVTTDTISRWENRRYPSVKKENAVKLAEALEVDLSEILDTEDSLTGEKEVQDEKEVKPISPTPEATPPPSSKKFLWALGLVLISASLIWWFAAGSINNQLDAERIMPEHSVPGMPFPVLLRVTNHGSSPLSFILREQIPANATVLQSHSSKAVSVDLKTGGLKCLGKIKQTQKTLGYILMTKPAVRPGSYAKDKTLKIEGFITSRTKNGRHKKVLGDQQISIKPFHWADKNMDNKIDDQEILAVYDDYADIKGLQIDMDVIEDIWFGSGYKWDQQNKKFIIRP